MRLFVDARFIKPAQPKPGLLARFLNETFNIPYKPAPVRVAIEWAITTASGSMLRGVSMLAHRHWDLARPLAVEKDVDQARSEAATDRLIADWFARIKPAKEIPFVHLLANLADNDTARALNWSIVESLAMAARRPVLLNDLYSWEGLLADHGVKNFGCSRPFGKSSPAFTVNSMVGDYARLRHAIKQAVSWVHEEADGDIPIKVDEYKALQQLVQEADQGKIPNLNADGEPLEVKVGRTRDAVLDPGFNVFDTKALQEQLDYLEKHPEKQSSIVTLPGGHTYDLAETEFIPPMGGITLDAELTEMGVKGSDADIEMVTTHFNAIEHYLTDKPMLQVDYHPDGTRPMLEIDEHPVKQLGDILGTPIPENKQIVKTAIIPEYTNKELGEAYQKVKGYPGLGEGVKPEKVTGAELIAGRKKECKGKNCQQPCETKPKSSASTSSDEPKPRRRRRAPKGKSE